MTGLLALVADTLTPSLSSAVAGDMANLTTYSSLGTGKMWMIIDRRRGRKPTVVALLSLSAVTGHVANSTARVAALGASTVRAVTTAAVATLRAVAGNVSNFAALVAFLRATAGGTAVAATLGALTRNVTSLATAVAGTLLRGVGAFAVYKALLLDLSLNPEDRW